MAFRTLALCLACSVVAGCTFDTDDDYAVVPSWAINGLVPTDEECAAFGVDHVEFRLTRPKTTRVLTASCSEAIEYDDGTDTVQLGGFVTSAHFEFGRTYEYEISLVDKNGKVVHGARAAGSFQVYASDAVPWLLHPVEIFEPQGDVASYSGAWSVGASLEEGCAELGIEKVGLFATSDFDLDLEREVQLGELVPCTDGLITSGGPALAFGRYLVRYVAFDARNAVVDETDYIVVEVDQPGDVALDRVLFDGVIETDD